MCMASSQWDSFMLELIFWLVRLSPFSWINSTGNLNLNLWGEGGMGDWNIYTLSYNIMNDISAIVIKVYCSQVNYYNRPHVYTIKQTHWRVRVHKVPIQILILKFIS